MPTANCFPTNRKSDLMKLQIVSDVHVEISKENFNIYLNPKASIVALLGDIG
jgi:predicted phosphodiesterase